VSGLQLPSIVGLQRIIPISRGHDPEQVAVVAGALRASGLGIIEITLDSPGALESIAGLSSEDQLVGAGTVRSEEAANAAISAGADFIVSPHLNGRIVAAATSRGIPAIAGALTPTEMVAAWEAGASAVKVFPASIGGARYIRDLRGPFGDIPLIPTGGVTLDSARDYLDAGAVAVGLGGWLTGTVDPDMIQARASLLRALFA
jgi:2-dehydro-3-deoxyphosphogluconate aldolase/(4S)-4-hydroxy-2-oxoglutarate aldolase